MKPEKWEKIKDLFAHAAELDAAARADFVAAITDATIRREVEDLLDADESAMGFLDDPALVTEVLPADGFGKYRIIREIGRGGMGTVYLAEREDVKQKVALKVIRQYADSELILRRFRREQEILAGLEHPNIARLLDVGIGSDNSPFLAMEYVEGDDLLDYCRNRNLSVDDKITLFRQVCAAVSHAHGRLVVHRDLKPSNIMVTTGGDPKLLDFGISKLISSTENAAKGTVTSFGMLTPNYASPEQFRGETVSTSTDVYSLGVILYQVFTGVLPYEIDGKPYPEAARIVAGTEPVRPSMADRSEGRSSARSFARDLKGDLDNIILKSLRKEPERRYSSVEQLSEDLRRYQQALPITARPDTFSYRAGKFVKRNRAVVFSGSLVFLALLAGVTGISWQYVRAERQRALAEKRFDQVRQMANNVVFKYYDEADKLVGSTKMRGMMVTDALTYMDGLAADAAGDTALQKELGLAYLRIGKVQGRIYNANLGDTVGAVSSYRKGIDLLEPIVLGTDDAKIQWEFVSSLGEVASILRRQGNSDEADAFFKRAAALGDKFAALHPDDTTLLTRNSYNYYFLGDMLPVGRGENENITVYRLAASVAEKVLAREPNHPRANNIYAAAQQRIGNQLILLARDEDELGNADTAQKLRVEAGPYYSKSIEISQKLFNAAPDDALNQGILSAAKFNESEYLFEVGQYEKALTIELTGLKESDERVKADPENRENKLNSTYIFSALSSVYARLGKPDQAASNYKIAMQIFDELTAADPSNLDYFQRRLITGYAYADELARLGHFNEARDIYTHEFAVFENVMKEKDPPFTSSTRGLMLEKIADCGIGLAADKTIPPDRHADYKKSALENLNDSLGLYTQFGAQLSPGVTDKKRIEIVKRKIAQNSLKEAI